jgi:hypothetical protein
MMKALASPDLKQRFFEAGVSAAPDDARSFQEIRGSGDCEMEESDRGVRNEVE